MKKKNANMVFIPCLSVNPNNMTRYTLWNGDKRSRKINLFGPPPMYKDTKGIISEKGKRRMKKAISWLIEITPEKQFFCEIRKKTLFFQLNFITLTLPSSQFINADEYENLPKSKKKNFTFSDIQTKKTYISDQLIKSKCFNNILTQLRQEFGVKMYLWRAETQENGNIHFHIITDTFIPHEKLREKWNKAVNLLGFVDEYTKKHENLSFKDYLKIYPVKNTRNNHYQDRRRQFFAGKFTNWKNPNSTDIHSLKKVKDIFAYLSKYCSKNDEKRRRIYGNIWGLSQNLSKIAKSNVVIEEDSRVYAEIQHLKRYFKYETLEHCEIIKARFKDWRKIFNEKDIIFDKYKGFCRYWSLKIYDNKKFEKEKENLNQYYYEKPKPA